MIGATLQNRYRLDAELGRGGMGVVYRAHDTLLDRPVAVKVLSRPDLGTEGRARMLREARLAAQLSHPNVVSVHDAGEFEGSPFIVMELVEGQSLHARWPHPVEEIVEIARQVCAALDHAHAHGIVHRDLKPSNLLVAPGGTVKLADFGLARSAATQLTMEGGLVGTANYMAPEQALGRPLDGRADLYALGVMLYELATGRLPFTADDPIAVVSQHVHAPAVPPGTLRVDLPPALEAVILRLLAKNPDDRFASAAEVLRALTGLERAGSPIAPGDRLHNLPLEWTRFIGREREIDEVRRLLDSARLVTLTGVGGSGKTRLAVRVAAQVAEQYADGAWLVELASLADPNLVIQAVAGVLNVREEPGRRLLTTLQESLRAKALLLVLDNCEHLIDACARLVNELLRACPNVCILASTREALGIPGEAIFPLPSLSLPDQQRPAPIDALRRSEAVQFFEDRARAVQPTFEVTHANGPAIAQICLRLDGLPLALELAAARVKTLRVEQIAARLDDRFRLLTGGSRTALPRQQTLQALIDWSYDLLSQAERALLRRLSVFAGGWTLEAAEAICAGGGVDDRDVLDLLAQLVNKSLVVVERAAGEVARYRLLDTIRQYARDRLLEAGEGMQVRQQHLEHFLNWIERVEPELQGPEQVNWLARLEAEHDNVRAALEWSRNVEPEYGLRLAARLWQFWDTRGHVSEGLQWLEEMLARVGAPSIARVRALNGASLLAIRQTDVRRADALAKEALALAQALGYKPGIAESLAHAGVLADSTGDPGENAEALFAESLDVWRELGEQRGIAHALGPLATMALRRGDYERAWQLFDESLALFKELKDEREIAGALWNLSEVALAHGDSGQARAMAEESLTAYEQLGDKHGVATSLRTLGKVARQAGDIVQAQACCDQGLDLFREMRDRGCAALTLRVLARLALDQADGQRAAALGEECLSIFRQVGDRREIPSTLTLLGRAAIAQGDFVQAEQCFREGLRMRPGPNAQADIGVLLEGLACLETLKEHGNLVHAARLFGVAQVLGETRRTPLPPGDRIVNDWHVAAVHTGLGESAFAAALAQGRAMSLEQAVALALDEAEA